MTDYGGSGTESDSESGPGLKNCLHPYCFWCIVFHDWQFKYYIINIEETAYPMKRQKKLRGALWQNI